jgi:AAA+ ATPase superfamily predicted ATPase
MNLERRNTMAVFVGRREELERFDDALQRVVRSMGSPEPGVCLLVHGRRRVGKTWLVEHFLQQAGVGSVFFTASRQPNEPTLFLREVVGSTLHGASVASGVTTESWEVALRQLDAALPADESSVVIIDEFPYLVENGPDVEATFQKHWDRNLKKKPVLLVLVGSDIAIMEQLNDYDGAFHQRATLFPVNPLSPKETGQIVKAPDAKSAFDAYLITGGLPLICDEWASGATMWDFLEASVARPNSALVVCGQLALAAEFPSHLQATEVLLQIGAGERTFANVARAAGGLSPVSTTRALAHLQSKRVVAKERSLSTAKNQNARYRVADPYLRFWLRFIGPNLAKIERGRPDLVMNVIKAGFNSWRGKAVEPLVRRALASQALSSSLPVQAVEIGAYWNRSNNPEVDIVGADRSPQATSVEFLGTIKWRENLPTGQADLDELQSVTTKVPGAGASTPLVIVSREKVTAKGAAAVFGPDDLMTAW